MKSVLDCLQNKKILITCGVGGVGKTTVSAALAIKAAMIGKNVIVITIDPAKRLATSLGLKSLHCEPTDLTENLASALKQPIKGKFSALIPQSKNSFDRLVRSLSTSESVIQKILNNPILSTLAQEYSGANEYLALEELSYIEGLKKYDLIILDTPPSRNTLSFLSAPQTLSRFFEEKLVRWLVLPTNKLFSGGMKKVFGILENLAGQGFLKTLIDFGESMVVVQDTLLTKLQNTNALLKSKDTGFILVSSTNPDSADELRHFLQQIHNHNYSFEGVILNRSLSHLTKTQTDADTEPGVRVLLQIIERETQATRILKHHLTPELFFSKLPELSRDVHGLEDLAHVTEHFDH